MEETNNEIEGGAIVDDKEKEKENASDDIDNDIDNANDDNEKDIDNDDDNDDDNDIDNDDDDDDDDDLSLQELQRQLNSSKINNGTFNAKTDSIDIGDINIHTNPSNDSKNDNDNDNDNDNNSNIGENSLSSYSKLPGTSLVKAVEQSREDKHEQKERRASTASLWQSNHTVFIDNNEDTTTTNNNNNNNNDDSLIEEDDFEASQDTTGSTPAWKTRKELKQKEAKKSARLRARQKKKQAEAKANASNNNNGWFGIKKLLESSEDKEKRLRNEQIIARQNSARWGKDIINDDDGNGDGNGNGDATTTTATQGIANPNAGPGNRRAAMLRATSDVVVTSVRNLLGNGKHDAKGEATAQQQQQQQQAAAAAAAAAKTTKMNLWEATLILFDKEARTDPAIRSAVESSEATRKKLREAKVRHQQQTRRQERQIKNAVGQQKGFLEKELQKQALYYRSDPNAPFVETVYEPEIWRVVHGTSARKAKAGGDANDAATGGGAAAAAATATGDNDGDGDKAEPPPNAADGDDTKTSAANTTASTNTSVSSMEGSMHTLDYNYTYDQTPKKDGIDLLLDSSNFDYGYAPKDVEADNTMGDSDSDDEWAGGFAPTRVGRNATVDHDTLVPQEANLLRARHNEWMTQNQMELVRAFEQRYIEHVYHELLPQLKDVGGVAASSTTSSGGGGGVVGNNDDDFRDELPSSLLSAGSLSMAQYSTRIRDAEQGNAVLLDAYKAHVDAQERLLEAYRERCVPSDVEEEKDGAFDDGAVSPLASPVVTTNKKSVSATTTNNNNDDDKDKDKGMFKNLKTWLGPKPKPENDNGGDGGDEEDDDNDANDEQEAANETNDDDDDDDEDKVDGLPTFTSRDDCEVSEASSISQNQ